MSVLLFVWPSYPKGMVYMTIFFKAYMAILFLFVNQFIFCFQMPKYMRISNRGNWTQDQLSNAIIFNIPSKTLKRRLKKINPSKGHLGPGTTFGFENERRLCRQPQKMQSMGFPLTRSDLRTMVFKFAQQLNLKHKFNTEKQKAGYDFVTGFLERNQDIKIRKSEGISIAR